MIQTDCILLVVLILFYYDKFPSRFLQLNWNMFCSRVETLVKILFKHLRHPEVFTNRALNSFWLEDLCPDPEHFSSLQQTSQSVK